MRALKHTSLSFSDWPGVLEEHLYETYNEEKYSDLIFLCCDGPVYSCQSLLAPLSSFLSELFKSYQCCSCQGGVCSKREIIQIHLEMEQKLLQKILSLVHKGFVRLESAEDINKVRDGLTMLNIDIIALTNSTNNSNIQVPEQPRPTVAESHASESFPDNSLSCPFKECDRICESRQRLLLHLLMNHYEEKIMQEFGEAFHTNHGECLLCNKILPFNLTGYMKHIGVDHEIVIEYMKKDPSLANITLEIYQGNINHLDAYRRNNNTSESRAKSREEDSPGRNPIDMQIEIARVLTEIPIHCNIPGCTQKVSLKTMSKHFDKHIAMYRMENLRKKLYRQKTITKDQENEIEELELENQKLLDRLNKCEKMQDFCESDSNIEICAKIAKHDKTSDLKKLRMRATVEIETLPVEKFSKIKIPELEQLKLVNDEEAETSPDGDLQNVITKESQTVDNSETLNLKKLDMTPGVEIENIHVEDCQTFVVKVTENSNQISVKLPRKRKRNFKYS